MATEHQKLIHVAKVNQQQCGQRLLLLRQSDPYQYQWTLEDNGTEKQTGVRGGTAEEAIQQARENWRHEEFQTLNCGFRYTLPERDEVGTNALFYQMIASYRSSSGVYFDEELGSNCIVQHASLEARRLWKRFEQEGLL
jgi:hypothetical protein